MDGNESPALLDELHECFLRLFTPHLAVIVRDDDTILFEVGLEGGHFPALAGRSRDIHGEQACILDDFLKMRGGGAEIVVVLAIDQQDRNGAGDREKSAAKRKNPLDVHTGLLAWGRSFLKKNRRFGWFLAKIVRNFLPRALFIR